MNYRAQELPEFISSMKEVIMSQRKETEKAAANIGEYRLTSAYQNLSTDARKFFQMSEKQCERLTNALFSTALKEYDMSNKDDHTGITENVLHNLSIPGYLADKIWNESLKILSSDERLCPSPG